MYDDGRMKMMMNDDTVRYVRPRGLVPKGRLHVYKPYIYEAERINTPGHKEVNELLIKRIIISRTKHYY